MQLEKIRQWCAVADLDLIDVLRDIDCSGKDFDVRRRPGFDELMTRLAAGDASAVVVYRMSRFGRDNYETVRTVRRLREGLRAVEAAQARLRLSLDRAAELLRTLGSAREPVSGGLVPDPIGGPAVSRAFALRAAGAQYPEIVAMLNRDAPRPNGRLWTHTHVARMLSLRVYLREVHQGDLVVPGAHGRSPTSWNQPRQRANGAVDRVRVYRWVRQRTWRSVHGPSGRQGRRGRAGRARRRRAARRDFAETTVPRDRESDVAAELARVERRLRHPPAATDGYRLTRLHDSEVIAEKDTLSGG